jgi:hypothetical protein
MKNVVFISALLLNLSLGQSNVFQRYSSVRRPQSQQWQAYIFGEYDFKMCIRVIKSTHKNSQVIFNISKFNWILIIMFKMMFQYLIKNSIINFILGGEEVRNFSEFSYMLSMRYVDFHVCGASIIQIRWALTAAVGFINFKCRHILHFAVYFAALLRGSHFSRYGFIQSWQLEQIYRRKNHPRWPIFPSPKFRCCIL